MTRDEPDEVPHTSTLPHPHTGSRAWWDVTPAEARALQLRWRERLIATAPPDFAPRLVGGADMSVARFGRRGFAGIVVVDSSTLATVDEAAVAVPVRFPYIPGLLTFRELPPVAEAWGRLEHRPDVLIFDAHGFAHPRRFGLACAGGMLLDVPSIGCAKSLLVGSHGPLPDVRGATAAIVYQEEVVGVALRTRVGVKPVHVSIGHRMDLETAVRIVLSVTARFREPETTRRSHMLVNRLRREAELESEAED